jgi:hypothetical protein
MEKQKRDWINFFSDLAWLFILDFICACLLQLVFVLPFPFAFGFGMSLVMFLAIMNYRYFKWLFDLPPFYGTVRGG